MSNQSREATDQQETNSHPKPSDAKSGGTRPFKVYKSSSKPSDGPAGDQDRPKTKTSAERLFKQANTSEANQPNKNMPRTTSKPSSTKFTVKKKA